MPSGNNAYGSGSLWLSEDVRSPPDEFAPLAEINEYREDYESTHHCVTASAVDAEKDEDFDDTGSTNELLPSRPFKGFSTSISSIFLSSRHARSDCCSLACFGILEVDRTRYLLSGVAPPNIFRRVLVHIAFPCILFFAAMWCSVSIPDPKISQWSCTVLTLLLIIYVVRDCARETMLRERMRKDVLRRMRYAEEIDSDGDVHDGISLGQTRFERGCAHLICGCYGSDVVGVDEAPVPENICGCLSRCFANICCYWMCDCFFQFFGCCAIAQESREIERLVPASRRRIDYLSFQPYTEYYASIKMLRETRNSSLWHHFTALSWLSMSLVKVLVGALCLLFIFSLIGQSNFTLQNMMILLATFGQAFLILYFVHWKWNRFDLSLDAVIKYFACGFFLTTGIAVFFEVVETILLQLLLAVIIMLKDVEAKDPKTFQADDDVIGDDQTWNSGSILSSLLSHPPSRRHGRFWGIGLGDSIDGGEAYGEDNSRSLTRDNPAIIIVYLFLNAFVLAALVEELCKYFGYRMVEHPDFLSGQELREAAATGPETVINGRAYISEGSNDGPANGGKLRTQELIPRQGSSNCRGGGIGGSSGMALLRRLTKGDPFATPDDPNDLVGGMSIAPFIGGTSVSPATETSGGAMERSLNSVGAGVTVAMVSVALGFACCENLLYIFLYNGPSVDMGELLFFTCVH